MRIVNIKPSPAAPWRSATSEPTEQEIQRALDARYPEAAGVADLGPFGAAQAVDGERLPSKLDTLRALRSQLLQKRGDTAALEVHTVWSYPNHGADCNAVFDARHGRLATGVGHPEEWFMTVFDASGAKLWADTDKPATSSPAFDSHGNLYYRRRQELVARDSQGHLLWTFPCSSSWASSTPAVTPDGTVYFFAGNPGPAGVYGPNQRLYAVRGGRELWHKDLIGDYTGRPQVLLGPDRTVYLTATVEEKTWLGLGDPKERSYLVALDPDGGNVRWKQPVGFWPSYVASSLAQGPDGTVYACHSENKLIACSPEGHLKWEYTLQDRTKASSGHARLIHAPAVDPEGNIYLASGAYSAYPEGYLIKLDPKGHEVWCATLDQPLASAPVWSSDGHLYVVTQGGDLLCVDPAKGKVLSSTPVGDTGWNTFSEGPEGQLFLNTAQGVLAFQPDLARLGSFKLPPGWHPGSESPRIEVGDDHVIIGGIRLPRRKTS